MLLKRLPLKIKNNPQKVILQFFDLNNPGRVSRILKSIESLSEDQVEILLNEVLVEFESRHKNYRQSLLIHFSKIEKHIKDSVIYSENRKLLTGAYFSKEYSIEASALFNPSIFPHPDQNGLKEGELRFLMSLRATGEGHVSSIEFRSGMLDAENQVTLDPVSRFSILPGVIMEKFTEEFIKERVDINDALEVSKLLNANYDILFTDDSEVSERVIFPYSDSETAGMEDVRFVRFTNDDGSIVYYGTYTAYNGLTYKTQLIETTDFVGYKIRTLHGNGVKDKGMALFPRKVNGKYAMITREDSENIFILFSDSLNFWSNAKIIKVPEYNWEFVQLGNCGSPVETDKGWLLITHGVGPMRRYVIGACLLDLNDPSKIISQLKQPFISPNQEEREGYVPNVVYSCGPLIHGSDLVIPYAMSDSYCGFAVATLNDLLMEMK